MYTKAKFGKELKEKILKKENRMDIGTWAFTVYWDSLQEINDDKLDDVILTINKMELGPEFFLSYERLSEIAEDLILGKEVNLDY